jgi:hypothetical protein
MNRCSVDNSWLWNALPWTTAGYETLFRGQQLVVERCSVEKNSWLKDAIPYGQQLAGLLCGWRVAAIYGQHSLPAVLPYMGKVEPGCRTLIFDPIFVVVFQFSYDLAPVISVHNN